MTQDEKMEMLGEMEELLDEERAIDTAYEARVHALNAAMQVEHERGWQGVLTAARAFHGFLTGEGVPANVTPLRPFGVASAATVLANPADPALPLEEFELSYRSLNCLRADGYKTAGDVMRATDARLLRIPNFGRLSLKEVRALMPEIKPVANREGWGPYG